MPTINKIIIKPLDDVHFRKEFEKGAWSDRIILPGKDKCRVKVTKFFSPAGLDFNDILYACDETVLCLEGQFKITIEGETVILNQGETYHVPAGTTYDVSVKKEGMLYCTFSAGKDGTLPDDK